MPSLNYPKIYSFTVTTTAQLLLRANANRKAVLIYNNGSSIVELLSSEKAAYGDGIPIAPGKSYENDHFNCQGEYYVICNSGTVDIRVEEDIKGVL
jgi:hypothetical protein